VAESETFIATELADGGTLYDYLHKTREVCILPLSLYAGAFFHLPFMSVIMVEAITFGRVFHCAGCTTKLKKSAVVRTCHSKSLSLCNYIIVLLSVTAAFSCHFDYVI
jgi:hypothetical protein